MRPAVSSRTAIERNGNSARRTGSKPVLRVMNIAGFVVRNALRNKRRLLLSVLSVGVSLFLLVTLMVLLRELTQPPTDADAALRVAVRNKVSLVSTLPQRQRQVIEKIPCVQ